MGYSTMTFIVFLILKLTNNIDWSWWWVTAPLWAGLALMIVIGVAAMIVGGGAIGIGAIIDMFRIRRHRRRFRR